MARFCVSCGAALPPAARFCPGCRRVLTSDSAPAAAAERFEGDVLDPPIVFNVFIQRPNGRRKGTLIIEPEGLTFSDDAGARHAAAWDSVMELHCTSVGRTGLVKLSKNEVIHLRVIYSSGAYVTFELVDEAYDEVEEAALCVAAATPTDVILQGYPVSAAEAVKDLTDSLEDQT